MLLLQQFLSPPTHTLRAPSFSLISNPVIPICRKRGINFRSRRAVERESEFEVDPDKAREALKQLDQQFESLSQKKVNPPKIRAPDLDRERGQMREQLPEFSESFFAYFAFSLFMFTIFYNIFFLTVIKPSVDGPQPVEDTTIRRAMLLSQLPSMPEVSSLRLL
ncbi:Chromosome partition protein like [Actinidia chinensis var. chinensis]|uniref:Chromosome partition protein like n=1 Tax=Actinidia chinensis var. chinensis TaxID=1590841 RepID=A0A2R6PFM6_ACTCC|nr:Chromosome partition protein like [Actinidia chinensis var. chinensis]